MTALEKAARAAYELLHFGPRGESLASHDMYVPAWDEIPQWLKSKKVQEARAVLMAVFEEAPSLDNKDTPFGWVQVDNFRDMLLHILNEEPK